MTDAANSRGQSGLLLIFVTLISVVGGGIFANWDRFFPPEDPSRAGTVTPADGKVAVQNVYNLPEARGLEILDKQGFVNVRVLRVCSNSVDVGRVREVLLDNNANVADETSLVNQYGSTPLEISLDTKIAVKIATGPC